MTDRKATVTRIVVQDRSSTIERPQSHAHAQKSLDDNQYVAYVLTQMFKLGIALFSKRWPHLS